MRKFKNYILMILIPLIFVGCMEKGVSQAVTTPVVDNLSGYTWTQLQNMIDGSKLDNSSLQKNRTELSSLAALVKSSKPKAYEDAVSLYNYLQDSVYTPIYASSSSFVYSTSVNKVKSLNDEVIGDLGIYTYDELVVIRNAFKTLNKTDELAVNLLSTLNTTISTIDERRAANPFYSYAYLLYQEYNNFINNITYTTYLSSIGFDINSILIKSTNISDALTVLNREIDTINNSGLSFTERSSLLSYMNQLKTAYTNYINGTITITNVENARALIYAYENAIISDGAYLQFYFDKIEEVYTELGKITNPGVNTQTILDLRAHINSYKEKNVQFENKNYLVAHSRVANVLTEYTYLVSMKYTLEVTLGLVKLHLGEVSIN